MTKDILNILNHLRSEGLEVINWMPGTKRIFKVLDNKNVWESNGMYSIELKAWFNGYLKGQRKEGTI